MKAKIPAVGKIISFGLFLSGQNPYKFEDLQSGVTYYRFWADNTSYSSWSETGTFTTLQFDQGVLRFHTGEDETGTELDFTGTSKMVALSKKLRTPTWMPKL